MVNGGAQVANRESLSTVSAIAKVTRFLRLLTSTAHRLAIATPKATSEDGSGTVVTST